MANQSNWKNFERQVAQALGGKRRLRTLESYGKEATDVFFPKAFRKENPCVKTVAIECKKRRSINVHVFFSEAKLKYGRTGKRIILATRIPATQRAAKKWKRLRRKLKEKSGEKLRRKDFIAPLVTVDLDFFKELWDAWLGEKNGQ